MKSFLTPSKLRSTAWFLAPLAAAGILALSGGAPPHEFEEPEDDETLMPVSGGERYAAAPERIFVLPSDALADELIRLASIRAEIPFASDNAYRQEEPGDAGDPSEFARELPVFRLTSVMSGGAGTVCVINDRVRRVGDWLAEGWVVKAIDASERRVVIQSPSGEELVLAQH